MSPEKTEKNIANGSLDYLAGCLIWVLSGLLAMVLLIGCDKPASGKSEDTFELKELQSFTNDFVITNIAWHPDGRFLAVGQELDKRIAVWDTKTGKRAYTIESEAGGVRSLTYSPDGKYLAVGRELSRLIKGGGHLHLYDTGSGHLVKRFPASTDPTESYDPEAIAFSPDGRYIAASGYGSRVGGVVYDMTTGDATLALPDMEEPRMHNIIHSMSFSSDGKFVAIGRISGEIDIWSIPNKNHLKRLKGQSGGVSALVFSPDGNYLASGTHVGKRYDRSVKPSRPIHDQFNDDVQLWSLPTFEKVIAFPSRHFLQIPSSTHIIRLQFFPDGKHLLVGARSKGLEIIDIEKGQTVFFRRDFPRIVHPALSPKAGRIAIGLENILKIYQLTGL